MSYKKFVFATDVHGDMQDIAANEVLFKFLDIWKPAIRVFGGDLWDFRPLRGKANEDEKRESIREDFEAGIGWLKRFRPHYFLRGNHDERLWELAEKDKGVTSDYAAQGIAQISAIMARMKCQMLPYHKRDGILRIGHLKMLHGFFAGVYSARGHALVYNSCLFGHVHTIDEHSVPGLDRRVARSVGCLCKLDMDYNARTPSSLRHSHGFAYGIIDDRSGEYNVWQAESINGKWILPTDTIEL